MHRAAAALWALVFILFTAQAGHASGYAIYEWSARGNAMGGAFAAKADDPSAIAYNPAGITQLEGTHFQSGVSFIAPDTHIESDSSGGTSGRGEGDIWTIPSAYFVHQLNENVWMGAGMYSRVGLGSDYQNEETWLGRYNCSEATLISTSIAFPLAWKASETLSFAIAPEIILMDFGYTKFTDVTGVKNPSTTSTDVRQEISAQGWAPGYTVAAHWKPEDWVSAGLVYRGKSSLTVYGDANFDRGPAVNTTLAGMGATGAYLNAALSDTALHGTNVIPGSVTAGLMIKPMPKLSIEFDLTKTFWSDYTALTFNYDNVLGEQTSDKNWHDTWRWQVGVEYEATDWLDLRAGYVYDESPIPDDYVDYAVPGNDRQIVSLGAGLKFDALTVDLSYGYLWVKDRDVSGRSADGVFDSTFRDATSHIVGISLGYSF